MKEKYNGEELAVIAETEVAVDDILEEVDPKGFLTREVYMSPNRYMVNVVIRRKHRMTYSKESFSLGDITVAILGKKDGLHSYLEPFITKLAMREL